VNRIAIIGPSGAGKSTLAVRLGEITGLPVFHLDAAYWKPNWTPTETSEWPAIVSEMAAREQWIIDGNFHATMEVRLKSADLIIYLDFPRRVCLWRVLKRWLHYMGQTRPDMGPGCREQMDWEFLKWVWRFPKDIRPKVIDYVNRFGEGKRVEVLRCAADVDRFLQNFRESRDERRAGFNPPLLAK
jgi:adenylate kinase family enzyme